MAQLKTKQEIQLYRKYHIPSCGNLNTVKLNAVFINPHNSQEHEQLKFNLAWAAKKNKENYLTEAARRATDEEIKLFKVRKDMVIDFVFLSKGNECQIVHKHETHEQVKFYRDNGTFVVIIDSFRCEKCNLPYPVRTKRRTCDNCLEEK